MGVVIFFKSLRIGKVSKSMGHSGPWALKVYQSQESFFAQKVTTLFYVNMNFQKKREKKRDKFRFFEPIINVAYSTYLPKSFQNVASGITFLALVQMS